MHSFFKVITVFFVLSSLVVADNDGVIVIPQEQISKMLSNLEKVLEKENEAQKIISDNPQKISMLKKRYPNIDEETEFLN